MASLDATVGAVTANSYATQAEADDYFASRVGGASWAPLASIDKDNALITAAYTLDDSFNFIGIRTNDSDILQALEWPRITSDEDIDKNTIPFKIKRAQMELAFIMITDGIISSSQSVDKVKVGSLEVDINETNEEGMIPDAVKTIVYPLGFVTGSASGNNSVIMANLSR